MTDDLPRRVGWRRGDDPAGLVTREWLVTNGLGGYASGTVGGVVTRRFHGTLIAGLPAPFGRVLALGGLAETVRLRDAECRPAGDEPFAGPLRLPVHTLQDFTLELGLPVWTWAWEGMHLEKRLVLPHLRNTTYVTWTLHAAPAPVTLIVAPSFNLRPHEGMIDHLHGRCPDAAFDAPHFPYRVHETDRGVDVDADGGLPPIHLALRAPRPTSLVREDASVDLVYRVERDRGYDFHGPVASPGHWDVTLEPGESAILVVSTEPWEEIEALAAADVVAAERERRLQLLAAPEPALRHGIGAELTLAADQFVICPHTRVGDEARQEAAGHTARSVIAGYHWFTDWGRDTMIALEGLALLTGRQREAGDILRTFAHHVRDGLIPNLFPEGEGEGLYHTADATLWFFHALDRYETRTGDHALRRDLHGHLSDIVDHHLRGTRFGIGVDPRDGLLRQGEDGYQLTWMDAKVDGWVVTPRRGKAVEINALWYNALRLMERWLREDGAVADADRMGARATQAQTAFNQRFWCEDTGCLYDIVDCDGRDGITDAAVRPNQILAVSLPHPVLDPARWAAVMTVAHDRLLTPQGLRSLAPGHPDYRPSYDGDLRARDAAYHQGTVWGWLIGPFVDGWRRTWPDDHETLRHVVDALASHLGEAGLGTISEIFDAERPWTPRGCIAQAWSVAEALRCLAMAPPPND
ncbi:MAG TPA: amylo-alpha-1,6-glucosidase [Candidatus Binatia bacterium]|jgi:predicted glycogen debranching enzyme|nr:amylo-alpha-1,6-glucosidase [Candidatus Binatia bacterium]